MARASIPSWPSATTLTVELVCENCGGDSTQFFPVGKGASVMFLDAREPQPHGKQYVHVTLRTDVILQYYGVAKEGEEAIPLAEGRVTDASVVDQYGDYDLMAQQAESYLLAYYRCLPSQTPQKLSEVLPSTLLVYTATELALKAHIHRYGIKIEDLPAGERHRLTTLFDLLPDPRKAAIQEAFESTPANQRVKKLGEPIVQVENVLAQHGETYSAARYDLSEPTRLRRDDLRNANIVRSAPYPIFLPDVAAAILKAYLENTGIRRLHQAGANLVCYDSKKQAPIRDDWYETPSTLKEAENWPSPARRLAIVPSSLGLTVLDVDENCGTQQFQAEHPPLLALSGWLGGRKHLYYRDTETRQSRRWERDGLTGNICNETYVVLPRHGADWLADALGSPLEGAVAFPGHLTSTLTEDYDGHREHEQEEDGPRSTT